MRFVRFCEILLGLLFVCAAAFKALDLKSFAVQIRYYGVLYDFTLIRYAAISTVGLETLLGTALISGVRIRRIVYAVTVGLLLGFTGLVIYAWIYRDLRDCGCFGDIVPMGPGTTTAKNAVMIAVITAAWWRARSLKFRFETPDSARRETAKSVVSLASFAAVALCVFLADNSSFFHPPAYNRERPFEQFTVESGEDMLDLGSGQYLVAMLSAGCDECMTAAIPLNQLATFPELPPVVGLMLGDEQEVEVYRKLTAPIFPMAPIDPFIFLDLIGKEPPRFYIADDGKPVRFLDTLEPTTEMLIEFVLTPEDEGAVP